MKLFSMFLAALTVPRMVTAYGERGAAERALYYLLYLGEELLPAEQRKLATGCPGSRDGRCYFGEFLKYIEPATTELNLDKVSILKATNELGWQGIAPGWGEQEDVVRGEGKFADSRTAVEELGKSIMKQEYCELDWRNPPPKERAQDYARWKTANPGWHEGMPSGPGHTNPTLLIKNGLLHIKPRRFPTGYHPYQGQLNYEHFDGSTRTTSSADFQHFFSTMPDYQKRIQERVSGMSEGDPAKARGLQLVDMISMAADRALELRVKDHWSIVIDGMGKPKNDIERGMRDPSNFGQYVETDTVVGRWNSYEIPNMDRTLDAAVTHHLFSSKEDAKQLWDKFLGSDSAIDHMNVINTFNDAFAKFSGHNTALERVC